MGKKVHPKSIRLTINESWPSRWFARINGSGLKKYQNNLKEDCAIRSYLDSKLKYASIKEFEIRRSHQQLTVIIKTARPGLIIGKGGKDIDIIKKKIVSLVNPQTAVKIDIEEVKKPELQARIIAQSIADQLEKRFPYRRAIKKALDKIVLSKEVKGAKIRVSGRLNGSEIARTEWLSKGSLPLQTLSANIDYAQEVANTTYGTIGIKVWVHKENYQK
jgi:small subunit ribosomal protein S3